MAERKDSQVGLVIGFLAALWFGFALKHLSLDRGQIAAFNSVLGAAHLVALLLLARRPDLGHLVGRGALGLSMVGVFITCWISGQALAGGVWFLIFVPVLAATALPRDRIELWSASCLGLVGVLWLAQSWLPMDPLFVVQGREFLVTHVALSLVLGYALVDHRRRLERESGLRQEREAALARERTEAVERAVDLANARRELEQALQAREAFLAQMSHEVRTPLNGILGLAQLLGDPESSLPKERVARDISASGRTLLALLNNILDVSKLRAGAFELQRRPFDLHDLVESSVQIFAGDAWAKQVDLVYLYDADVPVRVVLDPVRLQQILNNLIGNALRHVETGSVVVRASVPGDGQLLICVDDTGPGVLEEARERIFGVFEQARDTRTEGTSGLGLSLVREFATRMGGRVWVEDNPEGAGARFALQLPVEVPKGALPEWAEPMSLCVLLAEPNRLVAESVACRLRRFGAEVRRPELGELSQVWDEGGWDLAIACPRCAVDNGLVVPEGRPVLLLQGAPSEEEVELPGSSGRISAPVRTRPLWATLRVALGEASEVTNPWGLRPSTSCRRVLVADDDQTTREVMALLVRRLGHEGTIVGDGAAAIEAVRAAPFDVVILDREMPEVDGLQAAQEIRRLRPEARVAMVTASYTAQHQARLSDIGVHDVFQKPVSLAELVVLFDGPPVTSAPDVADEGDREPDIERALAELSDMLTPEVVTRMAEDWLDWIEKQLDEAETALAQGDPEPAARAAHAFAGNGARFGAAELEGPARELDALFHEDRGAARDRAPQVLERMSIFCQALRRHLRDAAA